MKVKIGDKIYDPKEQPIAIILNDHDKVEINKMGTNDVYAEFPSTMTQEDIKKFLVVQK